MATIAVRMGGVSGVAPGLPLPPGPRNQSHAELGYGGSQQFGEPMDPDAIRAILVALAELRGLVGRPPPFVPALNTSRAAAIGA